MHQNGTTKNGYDHLHGYVVSVLELGCELDPVFVNRAFDITTRQEENDSDPDAVVCEISTRTYSISASVGCLIISGTVLTFDRIQTEEGKAPPGHP